MTPATQRQLFDLTVARVTDLKNWLERGDLSPSSTWRRAKDEREIRNLVAGWLDQRSGSAFTVAEEPEIANSQRVDIWLQAPNVPLPIPIELKLLDKNWTGPQLCERLANQLVGDYLRDGDERCGLMLLFWKGTKPGRKWKVDGNPVGVSELRDALNRHWDSISSTFPRIAAVEVIAIDLTMRGQRSGDQHGG